MKTLLINRLAFLDWYFSDNINFTDNVYISLLQEGKYELDIQELLESVNFIKENLLENGQDYQIDKAGFVNIENVNLKIN